MLVNIIINMKCLPIYLGLLSFLSTMLFFFLIFFKIFLKFIYYLWLCWVFVSVRGLSPVVASGATLHCDAWASHYRSLPCCGAQAPDAQAQ